MPTLTINATAGGKGSIYTSTASWAGSRDATSGTVDTGDFPYIESYHSATTYKVWRYFAGFDTSSLPDTAIIDSATVKITVYDKVNTDADGNDFVVVVQGTQASSSALVGADFDNIGTTEGSNRLDVDDISTGFAATSFTLNNTGRGWINKTGNTLLAFREGHDLLNNSITSNTQTSVRLYQGGADSTTLTIVYHLPTTGAFFHFL